jgi:hypothetical protein
MATLTLTRPRRFGDWRRAYDVLVDGQRAAEIECGETVEVDLAPGRHEVMAKMDRHRSNRVEIEVGPGGRCHFEVGSRWSGWQSVLFPACTMVPLICVFVSGRLSVPLFFLPMGLLFPLWVHSTSVSRQPIYLAEVPAPDAATPTPVGPPRPQFTVRWMMIVVAVLAVGLWLDLEFARARRQAEYMAAAEGHTGDEATFRQREQRENRSVVENEARLRRMEQEANPMTADRESLKLSVARARARAAVLAAHANYHAEMRRKYEAAAAGRWLSVEDDPPPPHQPP